MGRDVFQSWVDHSNTGNDFDANDGNIRRQIHLYFPLHGLRFLEDSSLSQDSIDRTNALAFQSLRKKRPGFWSLGFWVFGSE
ncbi:hypothetical protein TorRG33x02_002880 [Trema orientale]|uniref:Uncharacterized protein n=1 Tax=Trema orientale TaxID=63057 RepID=A0A2P5G1P9_TREOI|nr:hypothetical protein TorRG33x02_002880 [Trema orientale]